MKLFGLKIGFELAKKELINPGPMAIDPATYTTPDGREGWMMELAGKDFHYFKYENYYSPVDAYRRCPIVNAIINRKAQAFINGKNWVLDDKGAVSESKDAKKIMDLLDNPNPLQSRRQFEAQGYIFQQLFGFNIVMAVRPFGFADVLDTKSLWNIPACWIDWKATEELFNINGGVYIKEIVISFNRVQTRLKVEDLLIIRDFTPSFDSITFPESKIISLSLPINNIIGALESRNVLINYRGALGILTTDPGKGQYNALPLQKEEKDQLQKDFRRYGLKNKQLQVILTTAALKWQQMGYATKELMLMEEVEESSKNICAGLNFPPFILGLKDTTFSNMNEAKKSLYSEATIPDAENIYEHWNRFFKTKELGLFIDKDYAHVPALQEDKQATGQARKAINDALLIEFQNDIITRNRWRELIGEDTIPGDDKYYSEIRASQAPNEAVVLPAANGNGKHKPIKYETAAA